MRGPWTVLACAVALSGCLARGHATDDGAYVPDLPPPQITDITVKCDLDSGRWRVEIGTDAWAGGGAILWTVDGVYFEKHDRFGSIAAAADGSADRLRNDISIVTDFRPAGNGLSLFTCNASPSAYVWVNDLHGERSDCRHIGDHPELVAAAPKAPECPTAFGMPGEDTDVADTDGGDSDGG